MASTIRRRACKVVAVLCKGSFAWLQRPWQRLRRHVPRRSAARNEKRMEALRACVRMITSGAGGCTTSFPFEAAIWLLEEQEELYGGALPIYKSVRSRS